MPGKHLGESKIECIRKLHEYFQKELANGGPLLPLNAIQEVIKTVIATLLLTTTYCYPNSGKQKNILPSDVNHLLEEPATFKNNVESQNSIEVTIKEVEDMLNANPKLPRLTRGEILDLIENLTKTETINKSPFQPSHFVKINDNIKYRDPKAIMMVLPFTPDTASENNVEDLYTKPPITQIIDHHPLGYQENNGVLFKYDVPKVQFHAVKEAKKSVRPTKKYKSDQQIKTDQLPTTGTSTTTTTTSTLATSKFHPVERKPHYYKRKPSTVPTTPTPPVSTFRAVARRRTTTTQRYYNHRYEDEAYAESTSSSPTLFPNHAINIVKPPVLPPKSINDDLSPVKDVQKAVFTDEGIPVSLVPVKDIDLTGSGTKKHEVVPFIIEIPEHLKGVLSELNLESAIETLPKKQKKTRPESIPEPETSNKENDELNNLLETLKLLEAQTATKTSTTPLPDVSDVVSNLSPDMRDLLMNFGLVPNSNPPKPSSDSQIYESYNEENAEVRPDSYIGFKPLPEDNNSRDDMQELLARFGLGRSSRKEKSLETKDKVSTVDMVPYEYHNVLESLGLKDGDLESAASETSLKTQNDTVDKIYATDEEIEKLNKLSSIVNQLEQLNRTLTGEDFKKIDTESLRELVGNLNKTYLNDINKHLDEQDALDPLNSENILKNEVKREEASSKLEKSPDEASQSSTEKNNTPTLTSEITEASNPKTEATTAKTEAITTKVTETPSIKDLEDSFGGPQNGVDDSLETTAAPPPPTPPETGFYYLLDWNTFLDIDDQKGRRVNLRFQPKAGNPMRFLSVSVP